MMGAAIHSSFPDAFAKMIAVSAIVVLSFLIKPVNAQDIHFSQFAASPLNLNPASTGFFDGDYRFAANHRRQWKSVTTPFSTFSGSAEAVLNGLSDNPIKYSAGLLFNNDIAGDSKLSTTSVAGSFSVQRFIGKDSTHLISAGLQAGIVLRSINYLDLTFDEQFDGDVFNPGLGNSENFENSRHNYGDLSLGISYLFMNENNFKAGVGFSMQHLNKPDDGFYNTKVILPVRSQMHLHLDFPVASRIDLMPSMLLMKQGGYSEFTPGTAVRYRVSALPGRTYSLNVGGWIRTRDAFIAYTGIEYNYFKAGISYDINNSDLKRASNNRGGYELSLIYIIKKVKSIGVKPPCPLY